MTQESNPLHRKIQSFVMRAARMTDSQKKGITDKWDTFGLTLAGGPLKLSEVFNRETETILEIGFGMGDSFVDMAKASPDKNFIGIEVHTAGVGKMLARVGLESVENIRCYKEDAVEILDKCISDNSLSSIQLYFPDPWHKTRHFKRRLVQADFVQLLRRKLKIGGTFHIATDWEDYAKHTVKIMEVAEGFSNTAGAEVYLPKRPAHRPVTKFEMRGQRLGHGVWDMIYEKSS